ncbi:MAG: sugar transferase [Firmicutes bacterium]|nr:sugar transferase [Bacillota bacterium]
MYHIVKRGMDFLLSLVGLLVCSPLLLALMLLIRADSKGAPVFRQQRVGRYGTLFEIYKLRTMRESAPHDVATSALADAGAHITRLGRFLRKTSLDELPQLVNVLRGDMSLVGPRPLVPGEGTIHEERMACGAYDVRPGITGWAQVNGRDKVNAGKKAQMDGFYAQRVSFAMDMRIILKSAVYVLTGRGIQEGARAPSDEAAAGDAQAAEETISL